LKVAIVTDEPRYKYFPNIESLKEDEQKKVTVNNLREALSNDFECLQLIFDENILYNLKRQDIELVFNLCNGIRGEAKLSQFPAILEFANIPYTGSSPEGHLLAGNKIYSNIMLEKEGVPVPKYEKIYNIKDLNYIKLKYPILIKPKDEGSSRGIHDDNLVFDKEELKSKVERLLKKYASPLIASEFIDGREFTVGVLGNGSTIKILPILEIDFSNLPENINRFYSFEVKFKYANMTEYHIPPEIDEKAKINIENTAINAYNALCIRDYARIDIRVKDGVAYVLDVNSLPGLRKGYSDLTKMAEAEGLKYKDLIRLIVQNALKRYNLLDK
jgi:D-alanine-D-alanine ligase